jgi:hypothetical protein
MSEGPSVPGWRGPPGCAEDVSCETSSTPTGRSPGPRAAYPGSIAGSANLMLNGHTSWEECRLPRYVIPLLSGQYRSKQAQVR